MHLGFNKKLMKPKEDMTQILKIQKKPILFIEVHNR